MGERRESYNPLLKSYTDSEKVNSVSEGAEVLYVRLLAQSDDAGRYYGDAKWVLAKLFTARMISKELTEKQVETRLVELENVGLIRRYRVESSFYLELVGVFKKLRADVKPQFIFPQRVTECVPDTLRTRNENEPLEPTQPNPTQLQNQPNTLSPNGEAGGSVTAADFLETWNSANGNVKARTMGGKRSRLLKARLKESSFVEHWREALAKFPLRCFSDPEGWKPEIEWFLRTDTVTKILEGKYDWSKSNGRSEQQRVGPGQRYRGSETDC